MAQKRPAKEEGPGITEQQLRTIAELSRSLRYGTLTLVFQDGALVQIDRSEKMRMHREEPGPHDHNRSHTDH